MKTTTRIVTVVIFLFVFCHSSDGNADSQAFSSMILDFSTFEFSYEGESEVDYFWYRTGAINLHLDNGNISETDHFFDWDPGSITASIPHASITGMLADFIYNSDNNGSQGSTGTGDGNLGGNALAEKEQSTGVSSTASVSSFSAFDFFLDDWDARGTLNLSVDYLLARELFTGPGEYSQSDITVTAMAFGTEYLLLADHISTRNDASYNDMITGTFDLTVPISGADLVTLRVDISSTASTIPEPATMMLFGTGIFCLAGPAVGRKIMKQLRARRESLCG